MLLHQEEHRGEAGGSIGNRQQRIQHNDPDEAWQGVVTDQESQKQGDKHLVLRQLLDEQ